MRRQLTVLWLGGAAAVIHGAPITTQDLDIVPSQAPPNLDRLERLLHKLEALVRPVLAGREIPVNAALLADQGQLNLLTNWGALDVHLRLHDGRGYDDLLPHSEEVSDGSLKVRTVDLGTLIAIKRAAGRPKDLLVVEILEQMRKRA